MITRPLPPLEYLNECLTYDPITGDLFWKERPRHHFQSQWAWKVFNTRCAGTKAGYKRYRANGVPSGIVIGLQRWTPFAQRIIYALMGVHVPDGFEIDHHNTDPFDNRWENLRLATRSQNQANRRRSRSRKHDLPKGVFLHGNKFCSKIVVNGELIILGTFDTPALAHAAYCSKATEAFGEFARFN